MSGARPPRVDVRSWYVVQMLKGSSSTICQVLSGLSSDLVTSVRLSSADFHPRFLGDRNGFRVPRSVGRRGSHAFPSPRRHRPDRPARAASAQSCALGRPFAEPGRAMPWRCARPETGPRRAGAHDQQFRAAEGRVLIATASFDVWSGAGACRAGKARIYHDLPPERAMLTRVSRAVERGACGHAYCCAV
jgi:hypothetical protein